MLLKEAMLFANKKHHLYLMNMDETTKLNPDQKADAARLKSIFQEWKESRRAKGESGTQEAVAHALEISQSAFSQFCRGIRPINVDLLTRMHSLFGWEPTSISPTLAKKMSKVATAVGVVEPEDHVPIKMVDAKASAGNGDLVFSDDVSKILMFRKDYLAKNNAKKDDVIAFPVSGNSMIDEHIIDGAVVLANQKQTEPRNNMIYVIRIKRKLYVKKLVQIDGLWLARSCNKEKAKDFPDIKLGEDDRLIGHAFWCGFGL